MKYFLISMLLLLSSCTYSATLVQTGGKSADVVDEQQTPSTTVSPHINLPIKPL